MTGKLTLALLVALFASASALPLPDLEEWTNAIQLKQTEKVKELLQTPRNLLKQIEKKIEEVTPAQNLFQADFVGYLVANKTIDKKAGWDVLVKFENEWSSLSLNHEVKEALDWFSSRCGDTVTPVSGDLRVLLEKAKNEVLKQLLYLTQVQQGFSLLRKGLEPLVDRDDPDATKEAIQLVDTFYTYFELGLSPRAFSLVAPAIDDFFRLFSEKKSGKNADVHETAAEEWKKAIQAGDKKKALELIEVPRTLFKKAYKQGEQFWKIVKTLQHEFEKFILNETVDKKAAYHLLATAATSLDQLQRDSTDVTEAKEWFNERCWDEVTPVSGDARAWFQKAGDAFQHQENDLYATTSNVGMVGYLLSSLMEGEGPGVERAVRYLWPLFFAGIGRRTGVDALNQFEADLDSFFQSWRPA